LIIGDKKKVIFYVGAEPHPFFRCYEKIICGEFVMMTYLISMPQRGCDLVKDGSFEVFPI